MILLTCCCSQSPAPACSSSLCNSKSLLSNFIHSIPNRSGRFNMKLEIRTLETMGKRWISYSPVIRSREAGAALVLACTERPSASAVGASRPRRMADVPRTGSGGAAPRVGRQRAAAREQEVEEGVARLAIGRRRAERLLRSCAASFFPLWLSSSLLGWQIWPNA